ncbi:MAG: threonylcarbamoyl-AMP synthase [Synergistaceae bacterium]|jgi:L-threonylcarbamoyladenylate synthase|nr:threonylcarbamoyl-AMP synthase [Synergistaceae bacterium]
MRGTIETDPWNPKPEVIARAAAILRSGGLVAFPTETVYGLGADGLNPQAVEKIFQAKGRPQDNPLILHLSVPQEAEELAELDSRARAVMGAFWPGPLTLVLPARPAVPEAVRAGLPTVALRIPDHPVALALIRKTGRPIAGPSANRSGRPSPTDAAAVAADLGESVELILDAGNVNIGLESTVIDLTGEKILLLRPGGMPIERLEEFFGTPLGAPGGGEKKRSPGTRYRHYAPDVPVYIWDHKEELPGAIDLAQSAFIGMTPPPFGFARMVLFDSQENYARGVFAAFRRLEAEGVRHIVAEWPAPSGIGLALRDRILRAKEAVTTTRWESQRL